MTADFPLQAFGVPWHAVTMELREAIRGRRMVRDYDPGRPVSRAQLEGLLELAVRAPSAGFSQGWHFLVLDQPDAVAQFWTVAGDDRPADSWLTGMRRAPVLVIALSDKKTYLDRYAEADKGWTDRAESRWPMPYWNVDTGMAALLILLGATDSGLASCLFGIPGEKWNAVRDAFRIDPRLELVAVISLGYAAEPAAGRPGRASSPSLRRGRRPLDQVVSYNHC